jgi:hypothetical protein
MRQSTHADAIDARSRNLRHVRQANSAGRFEQHTRRKPIAKFNALAKSWHVHVIE